MHNCSVDKKLFPPIASPAGTLTLNNKIILEPRYCLFFLHMSLLRVMLFFAGRVCMNFTDYKRVKKWNIGHVKVLGGDISCVEIFFYHVQIFLQKWLE